ncbi:hypothetical protein Tco_1289539, partial [Tanacetum coccineum]
LLACKQFEHLRRKQTIVIGASVRAHLNKINKASINNIQVCRNTKINSDSAELTGCPMQSKIKLGTIAQARVAVVEDYLSIYVSKKKRPLNQFLQDVGELRVSLSFSSQEKHQEGEGNGRGSKNKNWRESVKELTKATKFRKHMSRRRV